MFCIITFLKDCSVNPRNINGTIIAEYTVLKSELSEALGITISVIVMNMQIHIGLQIETAHFLDLKYYWSLFILNYSIFYKANPRLAENCNEAYLYDNGTQRQQKMHNINLEVAVPTQGVLLYWVVCQTLMSWNTYCKLQTYY